MKIEYENPKRREGIMIWEIDVSFLEKEKISDFSKAGGKRAVEEELKRRYGYDGIYFPSSSRKDIFFAWIAQIKEWETQKNVQINVSPDSGRTYNDEENDNIINVFEFTKDIIGKKQIKVSFSFDAYETGLYDDFSRVDDYDKSSSIYRRYTKSESRLGQNEDISSLARELTRGKTNVVTKANILYSWVLENIRYNAESSSGGAIRSFEKREGDSKEISFIYIVLMRAIGIPARTVSGVYGEEGRKQSYHSWTEFYLEGVGWIPVDCVKKMFGKIDNERLILSKGENILLPRLTDFGNYIDTFGIVYKRALCLRPDAIFIDSNRYGYFIVKKNNYLLIKESRN